MVRTNRGIECADCIGYVAIIDCDRIGERVWLRRPGTIAEGPYAIADCAHSRHVSKLVARNWVVDVDWETAIRWDMHAPIRDVKVITEAEYRHMNSVNKPINHGLVE